MLEILLSILIIVAIPDMPVGQPIPIGDTPEVVDFNTLEPLLHKQNDTVYLFNFWATWCVPCVHELPYLEKMHEEYRDEKVKIYLISLDFSNRLEKSLYPFLEEKNIRSEVIVLDDPKANAWINKVNPEWSGAIPATLAYNREKRLFYEGNFSNYEELEDFIKPLLNVEK